MLWMREGSCCSTAVKHNFLIMRSWAMISSRSCFFSSISFSYGGTVVVCTETPTGGKLTSRIRVHLPIHTGILEIDPCPRIIGKYLKEFLAASTGQVTLKLPVCISFLIAQRSRTWKILWLGANQVKYDVSFRLMIGSKYKLDVMLLGSCLRMRSPKSSNHQSATCWDY